MTPADVIREARNILFERGWHQGGFTGDDGSVCIRGALSIAMCGNISGAAYYNPAIDAVSAVTGQWLLAGWNDSPHRTFGEVIDALDKAEKIAESAS